MPKFKTKVKDSQLIVTAKFSSKEKINYQELDFFSRKSIRGFLEAQLITRWKSKIIRYQGTIGISLYERLKKPISRYEFFLIIEQIIDISQKAQANLLIIDKIVWDIQYIFINETTQEIQCLYLPIEESPEKINFLRLIDSIIYAVHPRSEHDVQYLSEFAYLIRSMDRFDEKTIEKFIKTKEKDVINTVKKKQNGGVENREKKWHEYEVYEKRWERPEETTDLDEGTVILEEECKVQFPYLIRINTEEHIDINKMVFVLGKSRTDADYSINNNAVSRKHAQIIIKNKKCVIVDLNSKNKTYVNECPIPFGKEIEIFSGDRLRLANEEFLFYY